MNYEELENKPVDYVWKSGKTFKGRVIGCDPDIGVTIVSAADKNHYLLCLVGVSSPQWKKYGFDKHIERNKLVFDELIKQIKEGTVHSNVGDIAYPKGTTSDRKPEMDDCAFGQ